MLSLLNGQIHIDEHRFGSIPDTPVFGEGVEEAYPAELCTLVRACLSQLPGDRPTIEMLWNDVHMKVASFTGLTRRPMKDLPRGDTEVLRFPAETNILFAAPN